MIEKDKKKIWYLYFDKLYSYDELEAAFFGKYSYAELKSVIKEKYDQYWGKHG